MSAQAGDLPQGFKLPPGAPPRPTEFTEPPPAKTAEKFDETPPPGVNRADYMNPQTGQVNERSYREAERNAKEKQKAYNERYHAWELRNADAMKYDQATARQI